MLEQIKQFLAPPIFESEENTRVASILNTIIIIFFVALAFTVTVLLTGSLVTGSPLGPMLPYLVAGILLVGLFVLTRQERVQLASNGLSLLLVFAAVTFSITEGGSSSPPVMSFLLSIVLAGLLSGGRAALIFAFINTIIISTMIYFESTGEWVFPTPENRIPPVVVYSTNFFLIAFLLRMAAQSINNALESARRSNRELEALSASLEQRVIDRTRALETTTDVSRSLSTILDTDKLVAEVVEQVRTAFNYYHAHIYLFDDANQDLLMVGGTGRAGQIMLASDHKIPQGQGLVGRSATTNSTTLVPDVNVFAGWLPNPLLPDTKSEVAVPIALGEQVLGVLDVQHNVVNGLTQDDVDLLQSIANQVAIALQNARLFEQTQKRAEHEALINTISHKIQSATTIEGVLQVAAQELGQALETQKTSVQLSGTMSITNGRR